MKIILSISLFTVLFIFSFTSTTNAQEIQPDKSNIIVVGTKKTVEATGKVSYFIVKETANLGWETTKFTTKEIVVPTAKYIVVKGTPKVSLATLKTGVKTIRKTAPIAIKAAITYLKL